MSTERVYERSFDEDVEQNERNTCPECSGRVTTNTHETVCDDCGLVIDEQRIDPGPEWREFRDEASSRRRVGAPNTVARHDNGMGSVIGWKKDANGRTLKGSKRRQVARLRREHDRAQTGSKREYNRRIGMFEIRRMACALGLPASIRDQACQLFRSAQDAELLRGRSIEAIATASLYAVCRLNEQPRTFAEVTTASKVSRGRIENAYNVLNRELGLPVPPAKPDVYLPQLASDLGVSSETERRARQLLDDARERTLCSGCHPAGVAAGCLYAAAQERCEDVSQTAVAELADISAATVRARYREVVGEIET